MRPIPPHSVLNLMWFILQITEFLQKSYTLVIYPDFFGAPCRRNYALDRKMIPSFRMVSMSSNYAKFEGDRTMRAGCRCKNVVFVCFCLSRSEPGTLFIWGGHFEPVLCPSLQVDFDAIFIFFGRNCPFRWTRDCLLPSPGCATIFPKLQLKTAKTTKIGGKVCGHHFA